MNQASYDLGRLARLARNELITRIPHRNRYTPTPDGLRFAIFYSKVHDRLLRPLMAATSPRLHSGMPCAPSITRFPSASPRPGCPLPPNSQDTHPETERQPRNSRPTSQF